MKRERLRAFRSLAREGDQLRDQIREVEARLFSAKGQRYTTTPRAASSDGHTMDDAAIFHLQLQDRYRSQLARIEREQLAIEMAIAPLPPEERMVIRFRYLDALRWEDVCEKMSYSWTQTHRIHASALHHLEAEE